MPIYEYICDRCGGEAAYLILPSDHEPPRCDRCGSRRLRRVMSRTNIAGARSVDESALHARPREFLERPERFGEAMRAFAARTGMKLSREQLDGAIDRLSEAKKKS